MPLPLIRRQHLPTHQLTNFSLQFFEKLLIYTFALASMGTHPHRHKHLGLVVVCEHLDFLCVHLYPEHDKRKEEMETLKGFSIGKPVVVEETFPLKCSLAEFGEFIDASKPAASGWIGFYWGKTPEELRASKTIPDALMLGWLEYFERAAKAQKNE